MPETPQTQLDAVNKLLRTIGESEVEDLTPPYGVDVESALSTLTEVSREVQLRAWQFNTEYGYPLPLDTNGNIPAPANALVVDVDRREYPSVDAVLRGPFLYDRLGHTDIFTQDLTARVVLFLPFDKLPESARSYISYRAARLFQDNSNGSNDLHRYNERDEIMAYASMANEQAEDEDLDFLGVSAPSRL